MAAHDMLKSSREGIAYPNTLAYKIPIVMNNWKNVPKIHERALDYNASRISRGFLSVSVFRMSFRGRDHVRVPRFSLNRSRAT
nr:unnamed protein product [Callosobruchus chinensis]